MDSINGRNIPSISLTEPSTPPGRIKVVDESMSMRSLPSRLEDENNTYMGHTDSINDIRSGFIGINDLPPSRESFGGYRNGRSLDRSRSATPRSISRRSITPRRYVDSRRVSAVFGEINKRRRRSSMVINNNGEPVYDPQYVGPITVDYLRFLCKVVVQERQVQLPQQETEDSNADIHSEHIESSKKSKTLGEDTNIEQNLPNDILAEDDDDVDMKINSYDQSLQLPSDTDILLKSPIQVLEKSHLQFNFEHKSTTHGQDDPFFEPKYSELNEEKPTDEKEPKQKSFSYLEKILKTRKLKMMESKESENEQDTSNVPHPNKIDQIKKNDTEADISFVIRNEVPSVDYDIEFTTYEETKYSDRNSAAANDDVNNGDGARFNESNDNARESYDNNIIENTKSLDELGETPDFPKMSNQRIITTSTESQEDPETQNIPDENPVGVSELEIPTNNDEIQNEPIDYQTPVNDISDEIILNSDLVSNTNLNNSMVTRLDMSDLPNEYNILSGGSSPTGIIQEEYTLDHNDNENSLHFDNEFSDSSDRDTDYYAVPEDASNSKQNRMNIPDASIQNPGNGGNSFSFNSIKKLVKSIQMMNSHTEGSGKQAKKKPRFSQETYSYIQESSDLFLENIMSDLSAYSLHRTNGKSNQINIKDVLLLLNRINFAGHHQNSSTAIQDIMDLAQHFLPLELLIALDNNLGQIKKGRNGELGKTVNTNSYKSESDFTNSDDDLDYKV